VVRQFKNIVHWLNACLAVIWYGYPARHLTVVGVTGTDGKTTTSTLIYHLLKTAGCQTALVTTVGAFLGNQSINTGFHTTTPSPWLLQRLIRQAVRRHFTHLVLECTSHGLDQSRLLGTHRLIGVITNLTHEHLDYHGNMDRYLKAKLKIFHGTQYAVVNSQSAYFDRIKASLNRLVVSFGSQPVESSLAARFPENYNRQNAQAAVTVARLLNLDEAGIAAGIKSFPGVPGRLEEIKNSRHLRILVDFAHTPNAIKQVLSAIKPPSPHRLIVIFGATGRRDMTKRPLMGELVAKLADYAIITSDDCYDESPGVIINQIKSGLEVGHDRVISIADRSLAIAHGLAIARAGDTVAVLGKGHETVINLNGDRPWSDITAIKEILNSSGKKS
jgi:UDP-N-acetylmuramoyl-L-alanyl-D-glutamate--2,6-diaminopimelate ligase